MTDVRIGSCGCAAVLLLACAEADPASPPVPSLTACCPAESSSLKDGADPVPLDAPSILGWASSVVEVKFGERVDDTWRNAKLALGSAQGTSTDVVSLGEGGTITLRFEPPLRDGPGPDLAVFENSFSDDFLEFARVDVSPDGKRFYRFPARSDTQEPVDAFGTVDPTGLVGLAGKYRAGLGTPFDLSDLAALLASEADGWEAKEVGYVRLIDVVGDGSEEDCLGRPIYDPYPTRTSAGFDLDAIAALNLAKP